MAQMQEWFDAAPVPNAENNQGCTKEVARRALRQHGRRASQSSPGAARLLTDEFNLDTAKTFAQQWTDHGTEPENDDLLRRRL